ncbi:MAG: DUF924 family protein, partial [Polyangiales bacterium]
MFKPAPIDHIVHPLIRDRWSPRAFDDRPVSGAQLRRLFEAWRWAASCFNEQPWQVILARKEDGDAFNEMLNCLAEANQRWARDAAVLFIVVVHDTFVRNGKTNRYAAHDAGLALAQMSLQAQAERMALHPMAGFDAEAVRARYGVPDGYTPITAVALGYRAIPARMDPKLLASEETPRHRKARSEWLFAGRWGQTWSHPDEAQIEEVLRYWFGEVDAHGRSAPEVAQRWWQKDPAVDAEIRERFGSLLTRVHNHELTSWGDSARGRLALILICDQFPRHIHRDTPDMFAMDARAQHLALTGLRLGLDESLGIDARLFFVLPLMHAESLRQQAECLEYIRHLYRSAPNDVLRDHIRPYLEHARQH